MKTAEKLAAGWLLTLGFMFVTLSATAALEKFATPKAISIPAGEYEFNAPNATYEDNNAAVGGLIFGVPTLTLGTWLALGLYRQSRQEKKAINQQVSDRLQSIFYEMLQENHGRVTVLGFAIQSQLPAAHARQYLDEKAKEFNANFKVNEEGAVSYHFDV
ncbi:MAG: hypothetical protein RMY64_29795 [Nostoc sp. DedQUE08]|uniref:hypothetical protein n=1 Tax=unclassified Nostoc TaxID=2593658 RepID=UPI002AD47E28|nr:MULTISPECIES: hypothetical protein [unclassified Nostoc]MDZ8036096.1 hypothetical protein [Nostoc sp. DedSLP04]MDZ8069754.1 hypothetical protein [Nostoc sp. DedQUE08]MDZ8094365.1 hypothetical protein [Nostoc sp. DedQUE05]MDZ8133154.1 hypothetical protein [Nostoc sp. DedQUE07]